MTFTASERNCSSRLTMKKASENDRACVAHLSEHGATWLSSSARVAAGTQWISGSARVNCKPSTSYFTPCEHLRMWNMRNRETPECILVEPCIGKSKLLSASSLLCATLIGFLKEEGRFWFFFGVQQLFMGHGVVIERPECCDVSLPFLCFWQVLFVCSCQDTGKSLLSLKRCYSSFWLIWLHCGS